MLLSAFVDKIDKAKEIMKVKEETAVLVAQCETYLQEKSEVVQAAKNLEESYDLKIAEMQKELEWKDKELKNRQTQIGIDQEDIKKYQVEAENLRSELQQLDSSILGNFSFSLFLCGFYFA